MGLFYAMALTATVFYSFQFDADYQAAWGIAVLASVLWEFVIFSPFNLFLQALLQELIIFSPFNIFLQALLQISAAIRAAVRKREREREQEEKNARKDRFNDRWKYSGGARTERTWPAKSEVGSTVTGDIVMDDFELSAKDLDEAKRRLETTLRKDLPTLVDSFFRKHYPGDGDIPFDEFREDLGDLG
ncbi:hypothetical protein T484DRAFT_1813437, partial [Baffinella frigidus]